MKVKDLIKMLKDLPGDYDTCLSDLLVVKNKEKNTQEYYRIILDYPINGIAKRDDTKEVSFLTSSSEKDIRKAFKNLGKVKRLE